MDTTQAFQPVPPTQTQERPRGRYVTITHVHDAPDQDHGLGGSSGGWVITLCEVKVTGSREATNMSPPANSCLEYVPSARHPEPIQPPPPPASCASKKSCSQLHSMFGGWVERTSFNTMTNVCGESDNGLGGCGKNQCFGGIVQGGQDYGQGVIEPPHTDTATGGWSHAHKICKDAGARLCTVEELKHEVGRGTGCQHDGEMVWTSESCDVSHQRTCRSRTRICRCRSNRRGTSQCCSQVLPSLCHTRRHHCRKCHVSMRACKTWWRSRKNRSH